MSGTEQYRNQRVRVLSVMESSGEAILGAPRRATINHRYPQAAWGPQLRLEIDTGREHQASISSASGAETMRV